ncbi:hypothetical protein N9W36_00520 [Porticoccaceae bacterium]|nr:hypothetical protein [Porticoccaceae bacterium]
MKSMMSKISIIILSLMVSTLTFAEEWLFVHTADEAQVINNTTIVMPVTRDIFAFTDRPYRKHDYMTGEQFVSLWADSGSNSFKTDPPNAVLTWVEGEDVKEAEVVVTGASLDGKSMTYTVMGINIQQEGMAYREHKGYTINNVSVFFDGSAIVVYDACQCGISGTPAEIAYCSNPSLAMAKALQACKDAYAPN